ncbi:MAG TPA: TolC family protein, partial [Alphaproteobacteria bacterium]
MKKILTLLLISTALSLPGCALHEPYARPEVATPGDWKGSNAKQDEIDGNWWTQFNSADLNNFIVQAKQNNNDIQAAIARIDQSRAQVKISGAPLLPSVNASGSIGTNDGNRVSRSDNYSGNLSVAYEADLWGKNRNTREAARKSLNATTFDKDALDLVVTSETAQTYFNILGYQQRINNAERNLTLSKDVARIIKDRYDAGAVSGQEVAQQTTAIASAEANLSTLRQQLSNSMSALNVLLGQPPQTVLAPFAVKPDATPLDKVTVPKVAPLQPSSLLERRPDIRSQEENLKAANLNI